ncbi:MAG: cell division protein FtsX [Fimbriimonas sp.]
MLDRLQFLIFEGLSGIRRNGLMSFAAITTVAVALFLIGGFTYAYWRASGFAATVPGKFDMRVFIQEGVKPPQINELATKIRAIPGVKSVQWIPKDKAWEQFRKQNPDLAAGLDNPYPDAFKVTISDLTKGDSIAEDIQKLSLVEKDGVRYLRAEQRLIEQGLQLMRWLGAGIGSLLLLTGGILIYNAIRLTVVARRVEIRVMQLVGASPLTIRIPFYIEGIFHGLIGGLIAAFLVGAAQEGIQKRLFELDSQAQLASFPLGGAILILASAGSLYGFVCSVLAVRTPLRAA